MDPANGSVLRLMMDSGVGRGVSAFMSATWAYRVTLPSIMRVATENVPGNKELRLIHLMVYLIHTCMYVIIQQILDVDKALTVAKVVVEVQVFSNASTGKRTEHCATAQAGKNRNYTGAADPVGRKDICTRRF